MEASPSWPAIAGRAPDGESVRPTRLLVTLHGAYEQALSRPAVWASVIASVVLLQFVLIATHAPWLDEWQAVLIARQSPSLAVMAEQLHYEGHPPLWYWLLRSLGTVVTPQWIMPAANLPLSAATMAIILFRAPLPRTERVLLVLNELFLFEFFTVARPLGLGACLVLFALAFWRTRAVWPSLALLPLCDFFFGVIACILILLRLRDREDTRFPIAGLALFGVTGIAAAWSVLPAADIVSDLPRGLLEGIFIFVQQIGTLFFPWQTGEEGPLWNGTAPGVTWLALAPLFIVMCVRSLRHDRLALTAMAAFLGLLLFFGTMVYPIYLRHVGLSALLLVALIWHGRMRGAPLDGLFRIWLASAAFCGLATAAFSFTMPFDNARKAATFIRANHLEDRQWFAFPAYRGIAASGEGGVNFAHLDLQCTSQFMRWNHRTKIRTAPQLLRAISEANRRHGSFYLLTSLRMPLPHQVGQRIVSIAPGYDGQRYTVWKVGNGPVGPMQLPPCVPGLSHWQGVAGRW